MPISKNLNKNPIPGVFILLEKKAKISILTVMKTPIHICQEPDPVLRTDCLEVPISDIPTPRTRAVIDAMSQALMESGDGVAIAAPQIGHAMRVFIVAGGVLDAINNYHGEHVSPDKVFINPVIIKQSKEIKSMRGEGCLSVRFIYGTTKRYNQVTVQAHDEQGTLFTMTGKGLLAQIFQHEVDHLNGILFIDHADDVRKMTPEEQSDYELELVRMRKERMH